MNYIKQAQQAEKENNWIEAARLWMLAGKESEAETCQFIAACNEKGDQYRARVLHEAGPEPDKDKKPQAWAEWYDKMHRIYNEMFRTPK